MAGNIESHSQLGDSPVLPITAVLDAVNYGFSKLTVTPTQATWQQIHGKGGKVGAFFASIAGFTLVLWTAYPVSSSATPNSDTWFLTLHRSSGVLQMAPVSRPLVRR